MDTEQVRLAVCGSLHSAGGEGQNWTVCVRQGRQVRHGKWGCFDPAHANLLHCLICVVCLVVSRQAGRLLLRRFVCEKLRVPWSEIRLERSPRGKPYLAATPNVQTVSFRVLTRISLLYCIRLFLNSYWVSLSVTLGHHVYQCLHLFTFN